MNEQSEAPQPSEPPQWFIDLHAESTKAADELMRQFRTHPIQRKYDAVVLYLGLTKLAAQMLAYSTVLTVHTTTKEMPNEVQLGNVYQIAMDSWLANWNSGVEFGREHIANPPQQIIHPAVVDKAIEIARVRFPRG